MKQAEALDTETGFLNVALQNVPPNVGIAQPEFAAPPVAEALPAPDLDQTDEVLPVQEVEEEGQPIPPATVKPARVPPRANKFACMECGLTFKMRPELVGHVKKMHPDNITAILAPYPG